MSTYAEVLAADLEALFAESGLGAIDATYRSESGATASVRLLFDRAYQEVDPKTHAPIGATAPAAHLREGDLPEALGEEDRLVIAGQPYRIGAPKPDGFGLVTCRLQRVSA